MAFKKITITIIEEKDGTKDKPAGCHMECSEGIDAFQALGLLRYWEKKIWYSMAKMSDKKQAIKKKP